MSEVRRVLEESTRIIKKDLLTQQKIFIKQGRLATPWFYWPPFCEWPFVGDVCHLLAYYSYFYLASNLVYSMPLANIKKGMKNIIFRVGPTMGPTMTGRFKE